MKRLVCALLLLGGVLGGCADRPVETDWPEITREMKPWTRWWWLGSDVDSLGLTYNLEAMAKAGMGGVEVTPIYGVKGREAHYLQHLSPEWMRMLAFTESEAERLGMGVDMNTGTGWPFGGPDISIEDAATRAIFQQYTLAEGERLKEPIAVNDRRQAAHAQLHKLMAYSAGGEKLDLTERVATDGHLDWTAPEGESYRLIALFIGKTRQMVKRAAPGGEGYVLNHFDKEAVMRYFGKFERAFKQYNTPIPHSFFNDSYEVYGADWSNSLLDEFEKHHGYCLQDYFPELLANGDTDTSVRVVTDYRETVGRMLKDNFTQPWVEWAHGLGATVKNQAHGSPANLLDLYAAVDIPECETFGNSDFDIPFLRKDSIRKANDGDPTVLKYASSAAHVTGKPYTSSETFTWLTEHFRTSLSQCKPEIDQMFTSGVNHVYFHGSTYSPQEAAWPGWKFYASVDMSPTNTIWRDAPSFFAYITRVQSFLQHGTPDNDFLFYFPVYDIWSEQRGNYFTTFAIHGMRERLPEFCGGVEEIMRQGYDLDYISDHYIQNTTVENGLLKTIGGTTYKALILPAVRYIPLETIEHIRQLAEKGATIVFMDQYPSGVPGLARLEERENRFAELMQDFPAVDSFDKVTMQSLGRGRILTGSDYADVLPHCAVQQEAFVSEIGGQLIRRRHADGHHYFMTLLQNRPVDGWVPLGVDARSAMFFDPMTGKKGRAALRRHNGRTEVYMQLQPGESILLKTFAKSAVNAEEWDYYKPASNAPLRLENGWTLRFPESDPVIPESYTLETLGSWTDLPGEDLKRNRGAGLYSLSFTMEKNPESDYRLDLGDVRESARVRVNGQDAGTLYAVPFRTNIGDLLRDGENTIELEVTNLPANRIADYDRRGVEWRIFHEINFVSITYQPTQFDIWGVVPSGLLGPVTIQEIKQFEP
ncbi:glycosyl hydrolase family 2 [Parabacteroides sp. OttesenSCG-928-O15]|nr:glycosyl hydrolase family 2 [Parabacteroides sp. OttesenSCG-928-O15]